VTRFERYVAIGDSTTEGLDDRHAGGGYRGWADRLAERLAAAQGSVLYANLGVSGHGARAIREGQLEAAVAMRPDLAIIVAGMNDLLRRDFVATEVAADVGEIQRVLVSRGALVVSFTIPDASPRMRLAGALTRRTTALNAALREVSARSGALLLDLAAYEVASDPRLWSRDRLHANSDGHARIADAVAYHLGLTTDETWKHPLPPDPASRTARLAEDLHWARHYVLPWLWRRVRARSGHAVAKRPVLSAFQ
jgi:lysophospholipase L1-like esterase